jgi:hypothetical protein
MNAKLASVPLLALMALAMSGCTLTSDNPVSDPEKGTVDDALLGKWQVSASPKSLIRAKTIIVEKMAKAGYPPGAMTLTLISSDEEKPRTSSVWVCLSSELKGRRFASILIPHPNVDDPKNLPTWETLRGYGNKYLIYRYDVEAKKWTVYDADERALGKAAKKAKIGGELSEGSPKWRTILHFNETTASLAEFLASDEAEKAFYKFEVYERVR